VVTTAAKGVKQSAVARTGTGKGKKVSAGKTIQIHSSSSTKSTKAKIVKTSKDDPLAAAEDDAKTVDDQPQFLATMELSE